MSDAIRAGLGEVLAATRAWAVTLGLRPAPLPAGLARMDVSCGGRRCGWRRAASRADPSRR